MSPDSFQKRELQHDEPAMLRDSTPHSGTISIAPTGRPQHTARADTEQVLDDVRRSIERSEFSIAQTRTHLNCARASKMPGPTGARASARRQSDDVEGCRQFRFDAHIAAEVFEELAQMASEQCESRRLLDAGEPLFAAGALLLQDAKRWLEQHLTPYDAFAGDSIIDAHANRSPTDVGSFVAGLRATAIGLIQVATLCDYRMCRSVRPTEECR